MLCTRSLAGYNAVTLYSVCYSSMPNDDFSHKVQRSDIGVSPHEGVNVGVTPFRGKAFKSLSDTRIYYVSPRYRGFEKDLYKEALARGLRIASIDRVTGIWKGQLEPAVSVWIQGDQEAVQEFATSLGSKYNQDAVLLFTPNQNADAVLYVLNGIQDGDAAITEMLKYGIPFGRLSGDTLEIVDADGSYEVRVLALAGKLAVKWDFVYGYVQVLRRENYGPQP